MLTVDSENNPTSLSLAEAKQRAFGRYKVKLAQESPLFQTFAVFPPSPSQVLTLGAGHTYTSEIFTTADIYAWRYGGYYFKNLLNLGVKGSIVMEKLWRCW